jgi:20S proteasome alpha/beta subunit
MGHDLTICLAAICGSGKQIIMIADAMLTSEYLSIQFEQKTPKIMPLCDCCMLATAGDALVHVELLDRAMPEIERAKSPAVSEIVGCLTKSYKQMRLDRIKTMILEKRGIENLETFYTNQRQMVPDVAMAIQGEIDTYDSGLDLLVAGKDSKGAHIHQIINPGISIPFDAIGYQAIGSGLPHAMTTFIANNYHSSMPLEKALLIAYEAKKVSEKAPGVGSQITNISIINDKGHSDMTDEQVARLESIYQSKLKNQDASANWPQLEGEIKKLISNVVS